MIENSKLRCLICLEKFSSYEYIDENMYGITCFHENRHTFCWTKTSSSAYLIKGTNFLVPREVRCLNSLPKELMLIYSNRNKFLTMEINEKCLQYLTL